MNNIKIHLVVYTLILALMPAASLRAQDATRVSSITLTLLHTNDIHGHVLAWKGWEGELAGKTIGGMDRLAAAIKQVRQSVGAQNVLLLDAGDTIGDTMIADETRGKAMVELMNAMAYDAMVIGNHEPDFTAETLKQHITAAKFPVLAANILDKTSGRHFTQPYIVKTVNGVRVGILGVAYPNTALTTAKKNVVGLEFRDAPSAVREFLPELKKAGAQIVVVLSHYGLASDKKLAQEVPGINVIVGGHSHNRMKSALREGDTLIVQAGAHGSDLGQLDLHITNGKVSAHQHRLIPLDNAVIAGDAEIGALVDRIMAPHASKLAEKIGKAESVIIRAQTIGGETPGKRDQESPADNLFADLIREETKADVALLPGVGYGVPISSGTITADDLRNLIPHESKVVTMTLQGEQIRQILEQSLENTYTEDPKKKVGGLIQVSGLTFKYSVEANYPQRVGDIHVNNSPLELKRTYTVATNSLLAQGGHNYQTFLQGQQMQEKEPQYEIIKKAIQQRGKVVAPLIGRIEKVGSS